MATFADTDKKNLINAIGDFPVTFTFAAAAYVGTHGRIVRTEAADLGGFLPEPQLTLTTSIKKLNSSGDLVDRFPGALPTTGNLITMAAGGFRVSRQTQDEISSALVLDLVSDDV